jgi:hypothetical protein
MTGVETTPTCVNLVVGEQPFTLTGTAVAPAGLWLSRLVLHSAGAVLESASKALRRIPRCEVPYWGWSHLANKAAAQQLSRLLAG